jgi:hypothetical protein
MGRWAVGSYLSIGTALKVEFIHIDYFHVVTDRSQRTTGLVRTSCGLNDGEHFRKDPTGDYEFQPWR